MHMHEIVNSDSIASRIKTFDHRGEPKGNDCTFKVLMLEKFLTGRSSAPLAITKRFMVILCRQNESGREAVEAKEAGSGIFFY